MKTAVIAVDVQNDFISGSLGGEGRDEVIEPLLQLADQAELFIASGDYHPPDHCSFSDDPTYEDGSWPAHCIRGEDGALIHPLIERRADYTVWKGQDRDKEACSAFDGQTLDEETLLDLLHEHSIERVIVAGLCTDYCVAATARDAKDEGFVTHVYTKASRGVSEDTTIEALNELQDWGVVVVDSEPRGDREMTRDEAIVEAIEELVQCGELAEHANQHRLSAYFGSLCRWVRHQAESGDPFTVTYPDPHLDDDDVRVITIPGAAVTA